MHADNARCNCVLHAPICWWWLCQSLLPFPMHAASTPYLIAPRATLNLASDWMGNDVLTWFVKYSFLAAEMPRKLEENYSLRICGSMILTTENTESTEGKKPLRLGGWDILTTENTESTEGKTFATWRLKHFNHREHGEHRGKNLCESLRLGGWKILTTENTESTEGKKPLRLGGSKFLTTEDTESTEGKKPLRFFAPLRFNNF